MIMRALRQGGRPGRLTAWLALAALAAPVGAQELGRLLLAPAQRLDLVRARSGLAPVVATAPVAASLPGGPASAPGVRTPPPPQHVEGWVLRQGGRSTVWVDGVPYYGFDAPGPAREALARRGLLGRDGGSASGLRAQPGQVVDSDARRTTDLLPEGALRIRKGLPPGATER
jgi:hypothetical protein